MKKFVISLLITILMIGTYITCNASIPNPTKNFYVNDFANVIDAEDEAYIMQKAISLDDTDGTQVVVVTVTSLNQLDIETYAYQLFNNWEIGNSIKNNGVLILLATQDRKSRIEVGLGLEGTLTDGLTGDIQDQYMLPYYRNNNFSDGIRSGYDAIVSVIQNEEINSSTSNTSIENLVESDNVLEFSKGWSSIVSQVKENPEIIFSLIVALISMVAVGAIPISLLAGMIIYFVTKYNKLKEFNLKYDGMAEEINYIAQNPENYPFTPLKETIVGKYNSAAIIVIILIFFSFPLIGPFIMLLIIPIIITAIVYSNKIAKFKLKEIKYVCPECKHKGLLHKEVILSLPTYSASGLSDHFFKCPECSCIYQEKEIKPRLTRSSSSYGGGGHSSGGGHSGGGGRSGGGGSSRSF